LNREEILAVLEHEFSHLNAREPLVLFGLVNGKYLFRIFVLWSYIEFFGFFYLIFVLGAIYFVAKFFEARADLDAAIKIGKPKVVAGALRKIGFRRLQFDRFHSSKFQD
jgi:heat shock protein HtpX